MGDRPSGVEPGKLRMSQIPTGLQGFDLRLEGKRRYGADQSRQPKHQERSAQGERKERPQPSGDGGRTGGGARRGSRRGGSGAFHGHLNPAGSSTRRIACISASGHVKRSASKTCECPRPANPHGNAACHRRVAGLSVPKAWRRKWKGPASNKAGPFRPQQI